MPAGFKISALKRPLGTLLIMLPMLLFFSYIFAEAYDFDKLGALARQRYGEDAYRDIVDLQQLVSQIKDAPDTEKLNRINNFFKLLPL